MKNSLLNVDNALLLIIDIQEKLLKAQFNSEQVLKGASVLAEASNILGIPVITTEQYPKGLGHTVPELKEKLAENTVYFEKTNFGCCDEGGFNELLNGYNRKQIIVCGMESHVCVHQTVFALLNQGFEVHLVQDAVASRNEWEYKQGIKRMVSSGAIISCVEMVIFELLKTAKNPNFKAVQSLIK